MKKIFTLLSIMLTMGIMSASADLKETVVVNQNFEDGTTTLFTGASRITVANDHNVKFTNANNSTNGYSNATYSFGDLTQGAQAVRIQFAYWIANASCNYDVAFIIRDASVDAGHAKQTMGLNGAFLSFGRSRQSSTNYFSINHGKTAGASASNLGLWCQADIYIDLVNNKLDYTISNLETSATIKSETGKTFYSSNAKAVSQIDFFSCVNNESAYLDNLVIKKYEDESIAYYTATFNEQNNLTPNIDIFSDEAKTKNVTNGTLVDKTTYYFTASLVGYNDYNGSFTVDAANPTVNFTMVEKPKFNVTVNAVDGSENIIKAIKTIENCYEGQSISFYYPQYITDDNGKVIAKRNNFGKTTTNASATTINVSYDTFNGQAQFIEAEAAITNATGYGSDNCSMGSAVRGITTAKNMITVAETGLYNITYAVCTNNVNYETMVYVYANDNEIDSWNSQHSINYIKTTGTKTISNVLLFAGDIIKIKGGSTNLILDYVLAEKTGDATVNIEVNDNGTASYVAPCNLDFEGSDLKAYVATAVSETTITLAEVTKVAAGEAIVVKGESCNVNVIAEADAPATNLFKAGAYTVEAGDNIFALSKNDGKFHKVAEGVTIPEGKAYIALPATESKAISLNFDGDVTGIKTTTAAKQNTNAYNLFGQKVSANAKGIVIINGKKINNK